MECFEQTNHSFNDPQAQDIASRIRRPYRVYRLLDFVRVETRTSRQGEVTLTVGRWKCAEFARDRTVHCWHTGRDLSCLTFRSSDCVGIFLALLYSYLILSPADILRRHKHRGGMDHELCDAPWSTGSSKTFLGTLARVDFVQYSYSCRSKSSSGQVSRCPSHGVWADQMQRLRSTVGYEPCNPMPYPAHEKDGKTHVQWCLVHPDCASAKGDDARGT